MNHSNSKNSYDNSLWIEKNIIKVNNYTNDIYTTKLFTEEIKNKIHKKINYLFCNQKNRFSYFHIWIVFFQNEFVEFMFVL